MSWLDYKDGEVYVFHTEFEKQAPLRKTRFGKR
jgi:hypothetical protein